MDPNVVALAKVVKDKALASARAGLAIGSHSVDCVVHITGSFKVGADSETDVRKTVSFKDAFATVCGMLVEGYKQQNTPLSDEIVRDLIRVAMRQGSVASGFAESMMATIEAVERDCTRVTGTKPKKGAVTTKLVYEISETSRALRLTGTDS